MTQSLTFLPRATKGLNDDSRADLMGESDKFENIALGILEKVHARISCTVMSLHSAVTVYDLPIGMPIKKVSQMVATDLTYSYLFESPDVRHRTVNSIVGQTLFDTSPRYILCSMFARLLIKELEIELYSVKTYTCNPAWASRLMAPYRLECYEMGKLSTLLVHLWAWNASYVYQDAGRHHLRYQPFRINPACSHGIGEDSTHHKALE